MSLGITLLWIIWLEFVGGRVLADDSHPRLSPEEMANASRTFLDNLLGTMDPRIRPLYQDLDQPVNVQCGFYVVSLSSISEVHMDYKMTMLFREIWNDPRLTYEGGPAHVSLASAAEKQIWIPDIYFPNEKEGKFHDITVPNSLIKVYPNGTVVRSVRITLQLSCPMNLCAFPMDTQICSVKIESYAYETSQVQLGWMTDPVEFDEELMLPQLDLGDVTISNCSKTYKATGSFSCLRADFTLHRQFGFFLLQTYVPSILIVILSWISFWINTDAVPARISLGVTTVLTMTTQLSGSTSSIPKVSYPKAIDVWLSACMIFVFAALVEYAFVNSLSRKYMKHRYKKTDDSNDKETDNTHDNPCTQGLQAKMVLVKDRLHLTQDDIARNIDKLSRILFPLAFTVFNIVYWPLYTSPSIVGPKLK